MSKQLEKISAGFSDLLSEIRFQSGKNPTINGVLFKAEKLRRIIKEGVTPVRIVCCDDQIKLPGASIYVTQFLYELDGGYIRQSLLSYIESTFKDATDLLYRGALICIPKRPNLLEIKERAYAGVEHYRIQNFQLRTQLARYNTVVLLYPTDLIGEHELMKVEMETQPEFEVVL